MMKMLKMMKKMTNVDGESDTKNEDHLPTLASPPDTWVVDGSVGSTYSMGSGLAGCLEGSSSRSWYRSP